MNRLSTAPKEESNCSHSSIDMDKMQSIDSAFKLWDAYGKAKQALGDNTEKPLSNERTQIEPNGENQEALEIQPVAHPTDLPYGSEGIKPILVQHEDPLDLSVDPEIRLIRTKEFVACDSSTNDTAHSPFVGLINQGSTCYLNALLQALYHIPQFSKTLLEWDYSGQRREQVLLEQRFRDDSAKETDDSSAAASTASVVNAKSRGHKALLLKEEFCIPRQLQLLFARLFLSKRRAVQTVALTKSFRWSDRDVFTQHDISELTCLLFGALEQTVPEKTANELLSLFKGHFVDSLRCLQCNQARKQSQSFFEVPVDINGVGQLSESLSRFCQPETMETKLFCDNCKVRCTTEKTTRFGKVPQVLFLQLMRFSFDAGLMQRVKSHAPFAFPPSIDMSPFVDFPGLAEPYTPEEEKMKGVQAMPYVLASVLIHSGSASSGHYYAYIRTHKNSWSRFDDDRVTPIQRPEVVIPLTSFGDLTEYSSVLPVFRSETQIGTEGAQSSSGNGQSSISPSSALATSPSRASSASAYLLCYIRSDILSKADISLDDILDPRLLPSALSEIDVPFTCLPEVPVKFPSVLEKLAADSGVFVKGTKEVGFTSGDDFNETNESDSKAEHVDLAETLVETIHNDNLDFLTKRIAAITDARTYRPNFYVEVVSHDKELTATESDEPKKLALELLERDLSFDRSVPVSVILRRFLSQPHVRDIVTSKLHPNALSSLRDVSDKENSSPDLLLDFCRFRRVSPSLGWAYEPIDLSLPIGLQSSGRYSGTKDSSAALYSKIREETPLRGASSAAHVVPTRSLARIPDLLLEIRSDISIPWPEYVPEQIPMLVQMIPPTASITLLKEFSPFHAGNFSTPLAVLKQSNTELVADLAHSDGSSTSGNSQDDDDGDDNLSAFSQALPPARLMKISLETTLGELRKTIAEKLTAHNGWLGKERTESTFNYFFTHVQLLVGKPLGSYCSEPSSACPLKLLSREYDSEKLSSKNIALRTSYTLYIELPLESALAQPSDQSSLVLKSYLIDMWRRSHAQVTILFNQLPSRETLLNRANSTPGVSLKESTLIPLPSTPTPISTAALGKDEENIPSASIEHDEAIAASLSLPTEDHVLDPVYTESIRVSLMITLGDLKQMISERIGVDEDCFRCSLSERAPQFKDPSKTLRELGLVDQSGIFLSWGRPLQLHEYMVSFSLYHPNASPPEILCPKPLPVPQEIAAAPIDGDQPSVDPSISVELADSLLQPAPSPTNRSDMSLNSLKLVNTSSSSSTATRTSTTSIGTRLGLSSRTTRTQLLSIPVSQNVPIWTVKHQILEYLSKVFPPSPAQIEAAAKILAKEDEEIEAAAEEAAAALADDNTEWDEETLAEAAEAAAAFHTTVEAILAQRKNPAASQPQVNVVPPYRGLPNALGIRHFRIKDKKGRLFPDIQSLKSAIAHIEDGLTLYIQPTRVSELIGKAHRLVTLREWHPPSQNFGVILDLVSIPSLSVEQLSQICSKFRTTAGTPASKIVDVDEETGVEFAFVVNDETLAACKEAFEALDEGECPSFVFTKGKLSGPTLKSDIAGLNFQKSPPSSTIRSIFRIVLGGDIIIFKDIKLDSASSGSLQTRRNISRPLTGAAGARRRQQAQSKLEGVEVLVKNTKSYRPETALRVGGYEANEDDYIDIEAEVAAVEAACAAAAANADVASSPETMSSYKST